MGEAIPPPPLCQLCDLRQTVGKVSQKLPSSKVRWELDGHTVLKSCAAWQALGPFVQKIPWMEKREMGQYGSEHLVNRLETAQT